MTTHPSHDDDKAHAAASAFRAALDRAANEERAAHLSYEDIEAHVDGRLGEADRARVTAHLHQCAACRGDVQELEAFSREPQTASRRPGIVTRLTEGFRSWRPWDLRILVPVAACALVLVFVLRDESPPQVEPREAPPVATARPPSTGHDVETLPQPYRKLVEDAVSARRLDIPASVTDLAGRGGILLGAPAEAQAVGGLHPVGTVVETDRPVFTWAGPAGAKYKVSVYDGGYNEVATSGWIGATEWTMPRTLTRGARYSWQLTVRRGEHETIAPVPPAPEARFQVLRADDLQELSAIRGTHGESHLVLAVLYARLGLLDAADDELQSLAASSTDSAIAADLSASLKKARGL
jgi:anti-sigma factor RsiW